MQDEILSTFKLDFKSMFDNKCPIFKKSQNGN